MLQKKQDFLYFWSGFFSRGLGEELNKVGKRACDVFPFPLFSFCFYVDQPARGGFRIWIIAILYRSTFPQYRKPDNNRRLIRIAGNQRQDCRCVPGLRFDRLLRESNFLLGDWNQGDKVLIMVFALLFGGWVGCKKRAESFKLSTL
jgi:hypothetical protein